MSTHTCPDVGPIAAAERGVDSARELAHLTRPAITALSIADLYALTGALAQLAATLPQTLTQLGRYLPTDATNATDCLAHATRAAADLAVAVDATHQALGDTAETIRTQPRGGQFSTDERGSDFGRR